MADVSNAGTAEVSVTIKTLTVGNKRMPLGVYRQLRCAPLVNPDGTFAGTPWGTVNVEPGAHQCHGGNAGVGRNDGMRNWFHVVWERGGLIFRDHITDRAVFDEFEPDDVGARYLNALALRYLIENAQTAGAVRDAVDKARASGSPLSPAPFTQGGATRSKWDARVIKYLDSGEEGFTATVDELPVWLVASLLTREAWASKSRAELARSVHGLSPAAERVSRVSEVLESTMPDANKRFEELRQAVATEKARREAVQAARKAVADLPQLFIGA